MREITLQEIERLASKATPGPWVVSDDPEDIDDLKTVYSLGTDGGTVGTIPYQGDVALVAAAPDIARLAIELSEEVEQLKNEARCPRST